MNEDARNVILAIGALAETCREFYVRLVELDFTDAQAMYLTSAYVAAMLKGGKSHE